MGQLGPTTPMAQGHVIKAGALHRGRWLKLSPQNPARLLGVPTPGGRIKTLVHALVHRTIRLETQEASEIRSNSLKETRTLPQSHELLGKGLPQGRGEFTLVPCRGSPEGEGSLSLEFQVIKTYFGWAGERKPKGHWGSFSHPLTAMGTQPRLQGILGLGVPKELTCV